MTNVRVVVLFGLVACSSVPAGLVTGEAADGGDAGPPLGEWFPDAAPAEWTDAGWVTTPTCPAPVVCADAGPPTTAGPAPRRPCRSRWATP